MGFVRSAAMREPERHSNLSTIPRRAVEALNRGGRQEKKPARRVG
jgi:hypothetical protein